MTDFIKKPCSHCPYRHDVKPFLTGDRGAELAYATQNPYNTFHCHKTLEQGKEDTYAGEVSKICAGFLSLQHNELGKTAYDNEGFQPSDTVYSDVWSMCDAYEEAEGEA